MATASNYTIGEIRKQLLRSGTWTKTTTRYVAVCTAAPTAASTGSTIVEPSGNAYARVQVDADDANWSSTGDNVSAITWPTATGNWGTLTHFAVVDAATNGNVLFYGALTTSKTITNTDTFSIPAGDLDLSIS